MDTAVVFSGGPLDRPDASQQLRGLLDAPASGRYVVAVDSGLHTARRYGLRPDIVLGDMDSVDPDTLAQARRDGSVVEQHPADKDATDLELGLEHVLATGARRVVVIGSAGGRLDHLMAGILLLGSPRYDRLELTAHLDGSVVAPVRGERIFDGEPGATLSILAVNGPATVHTVGLRWPLHGEQLQPGSSRGVSNQFDGLSATVTVDRGCAVVLIPEEETS